MFFFFPVGTVDPPRRQPLMVVGIILMALVLHAVVHLGDLPRQQVFDSWGFVPNQATPATFLTAIFLHESTWALVLHVWLLVLFGPLLESRLGHFPFLLLYLGGGMAAWSFGGALAQGDDRAMAFVGAYGAFASLFGAFLVLYPFGDIRVFYLIGLFPVRFYSGNFSVPAMLLIGVWLLRQLLALYMAAALNLSVSPSIWMRMGGFVFGATAAVLAYGKEGLRRETKYGN